MKLTKLNLQKAAMFGLDARIALAIFGALSVISGAALYSAIQEAKVTSFVVSLKELEKSIEQYYLDNATIPAINSGNVLQTYNLVSKPVGLTTWNGPYIDGFQSTKVTTCIEKGFGSSGVEVTCLYLCEKGDGSGCTTCSDYSSNSCYMYLEVYDDNEKFLKNVDAFIDGENNASTGKVRLRNSGGSVRGISLRYQIPKI